MSVRAKLLLALAPLGIALVALGILSVVTIQTLGHSSERILQENYLSTLALQRLLDAIENLDSAATALALGQPSVDTAVVARERQRLVDALRVQEGNVTEPGEADITKHLRSSWDAYDRALGAQSSAADPGERRRIFLDEMRPAYQSLREAANKILALNQDAMVLKGNRTQRAVRQMNTVMVGSAIAAFAVGLIISLSLVGRVLRRLEQLTNAVERVGERDFQTRVAVAGNDELARLAGNFNRMAARLEEYRRSSLGELLQAQQASQAAIESIPDPVLVFGNEGVLIGANQSAERLLGLADSARAGSPLARLDPPLRAAIDNARAHVLAARGAYSPRGLEEAVRLQTAEGEWFFLPRATPVYSSDGAVSATTVILQDVTRLHRFGELKSDLVATAAHELRTPLTSLRMAIHLCLEETAGALTPKQAELLYTAREDCERLQDTVDELLDLARLQSGRGEIRKSRLDPGAIVSSVAERLRALATERGSAIAVEVAPLLPAIDGDPDRLEVALTNLVENALRYSPGGGEVVVAAHRTDGTVRVEVRDRGPGVPAEHRAHVFERFYRVPGALAGGAGLGLSIAREIVLAHGGEIGVDANDGGPGSVFWFTLPVAGNA
ncbi:MAG TPA: ATP-binding protein [Candidatus Binatia bacterium]|nr:ATP-binding protein [Candidatus Binatia bacterium]